MPRLCCLSRRRCKSFPIHERQREAEVNKIFIRHVESIRVKPTTTKRIHQDEKIETKSKATIKAECHQQTKKDSIIEKKSTQSRTSLANLFNKKKQLKTPSPLPRTIDQTPEEDHDKTMANPSSNWSFSTDSDSNQHKKSFKHRSCADSYDVSIENTSHKQSTSQQKKTPSDITPLAKSKAVLRNVRKMIQDQQEHDYKHTRQKESARL